MRPLYWAMLTHEYTYVYRAVGVVSGEFDSLILPHVNTDCMQLFLDEVAFRYGQRHIIMVLDGSGWHRSAALKVPVQHASSQLAAMGPGTQSGRTYLGRVAGEILP